MVMDSALRRGRGGWTRRGLALDADDPATELLTFLRERLEPEDYGTAEHLVVQLFAPEGGATDEPPPYPGQPPPGGRMRPLTANDSAALLARIDADTVRGQRSMLKRLETRFPGVGRVRVLG